VTDIALAFQSRFPRFKTLFRDPGYDFGGGGGAGNGGDPGPEDGMP
jgi:hypothetical protein